MNNSKRAIAEILKHEGGYVNHPSDPGGATNKGITIGTYRRFINPNGTIADLKKLTTDDAIIVYKRQYWDAVLGDLLPAGVDYAVADFAVNSGPSRAAKYLQKVAGVSQDGKIGSQTLSAVEAMDEEVVIHMLCDERLAFMKRLRGGKLWVKFGKGWSRRVADVRRLSLEWVESNAQPAPETPLPIDLPFEVSFEPDAPSGFAALIAAILKLFGVRK